MKVELIYINVGQRLKHLRELHGLTQEECCEKLGLTRTSVTNIEAGRQRVMMHDIENIAAVFNISAEKFMRGLW